MRVGSTRRCRRGQMLRSRDRDQRLAAGASSPFCACFCMGSPVELRIDHPHSICTDSSSRGGLPGRPHAAQDTMSFCLRGPRHALVLRGSFAFDCVGCARVYIRLSLLNLIALSWIGSSCRTMAWRKSVASWTRIPCAPRAAALDTGCTVEAVERAGSRPRQDCPNHGWDSALRK